MNKSKLSKRDICTKYIPPALKNTGWDIQTKIHEEVKDNKHTLANLKKMRLFDNAWNSTNLIGSLTTNQLETVNKEKSSSTTNQRVSLDEYTKYKKILYSNSILVSINGTIGNIAFYNNENVGKNGSGKSNLFEAIIEVFRYFRLFYRKEN